MRRHKWTRWEVLRKSNWSTGLVWRWWSNCEKRNAVDVGEVDIAIDWMLGVKGFQNGDVKNVDKHERK